METKNRMSGTKTKLCCLPSYGSINGDDDDDDDDESDKD